MNDDLKNRLRAYSGASNETSPCWNRLRDEAANLIDNLEKALRNYWTDDMCQAFAEGHDREQAAQMGEPNPWTIDDPGNIGDGDNWRDDRIAAVRAGLRNAMREGGNW